MKSIVISKEENQITAHIVTMELRRYSMEWKRLKRGFGGLQLTELVFRQLECILPSIREKGKGKKRWTQDVQLIASASMNLL
jgi:hypothetical protein